MVNTPKKRDRRAHLSERLQRYREKPQFEKTMKQFDTFIKQLQEMGFTLPDDSVRFDGEWTMVNDLVRVDFMLYGTGVETKVTPLSVGTYDARKLRYTQPRNFAALKARIQRNEARELTLRETERKKKVHADNVNSELIGMIDEVSDSLPDGWRIAAKRMIGSSYRKAAILYNPDGSEKYTLERRPDHNGAETLWASFVYEYGGAKKRIHVPVRDFITEVLPMVRKLETYDYRK